MCPRNYLTFLESGLQIQIAYNQFLQILYNAGHFLQCGYSISVYACACLYICVCKSFVCQFEA